MQFVGYIVYDNLAVTCPLPIVQAGFVQSVRETGAL